MYIIIQIHQEIIRLFQIIILIKTMFILNIKKYTTGLLALLITLQNVPVRSKPLIYKWFEGIITNTDDYDMVYHECLLDKDCKDGEKCAIIQAHIISDQFKHLPKYYNTKSYEYKCLPQEKLVAQEHEEICTDPWCSNYLGTQDVANNGEKCVDWYGA